MNGFNWKDKGRIQTFTWETQEHWRSEKTYGKSTLKWLCMMWEWTITLCTLCTQQTIGENKTEPASLVVSSSVKLLSFHLSSKHVAYKEIFRSTYSNYPLCCWLQLKKLRRDKYQLPLFQKSNIKWFIKIKWVKQCPPFTDKKIKKEVELHILQWIPGYMEIQTSKIN